MDRLIYEEMKIMNISYIFHFLLYIVMTLMHLFSYLKIFWINIISKYIFISSSFIDCFLLFYPLIPFALTYRILSNINLTKIFKNLSLIFIFISIILGIIISISLWINVDKSSSFYRECPYNYNQNNFQNFINKLNNEKNNINELCSNKRRSIFLSENLNDKFPYSYICNYDSSEDFSIELGKSYSRKMPNNEVFSTSKIIYCENQLDDNFFNSNIDNKMDILNYINICSNYISLHKCYRFNEAKNYIISEDYECPDKKYVIYSYLFGIFTIILDIILSFIPWSFNFNSYKSILKINEDNNSVNNQEIQRNNRDLTNQSSNENSSNSNNSNISSQRNNELEQNENSKKELHRQPTETIIIVPEFSSSETSSNKNKDINNSNNKNCSERELLRIELNKNIENLKIIENKSNNINKNEENKSDNNSNNIDIFEMRKNIMNFKNKKNKNLNNSNNKSNHKNNIKNKKIYKCSEKRSNKTEKLRRLSFFLIDEKKGTINCTLNYIKKNYNSKFTPLKIYKQNCSQVLMENKIANFSVNSVENENNKEWAGLKKIEKKNFKIALNNEQKENIIDNELSAINKIKLKKNKLSLINECIDSFEQDKNKKE